MTTPTLTSPSSHQNENGLTPCFGRILAGSFFLAASLLVWTEQTEYSEKQRFRLGYQNKVSTISTSDTLTCKIDQLELELPRAPNIIIAGAAKSGTTTMANWLLDHPQVLPTKKLECHFLTTGIHPHEVDRLFNTEEDASNRGTREDLVCELRKRYLNQWPDLSQVNPSPTDGRSKRGRLFTFDKTPDYLFPSRIPQLIEAMFQDTDRPKIVILLRNPIDRAYSHYRMDQRIMQEEHVPFEDFIRREVKLLRQLGLTDFEWDSEHSKNRSRVVNTLSFQQIDELMDHASDELQGHNYLSRGLYAIQLQRWFRNGLGRDMLILPYTELESRPDLTYDKVLEFAGLPPHALRDEIMLQKYNQNNEITKPMANSTRLRLEAFFEEEMVDLMNMLERHNKVLDYDWRGLWDKF